MNRQEFDATFTGHDLASQVRAAIDFAQQHNLALGRSAGDQHFIFSRLRAANPERRENRRETPRNGHNHARKHRHREVASRPFGRSF